MSETRTRNRPPKATEPEPDHEDADDGEDGEDAEQAKPEPEPEPGSPEAQMRKIDNAKRKYRKDLEGIVGSLEGAAECELCGGLGFVDQDATLRVHPAKVKCEKCGGLGQLVTGSRAPGHETLPCPDCVGTGHVDKRVEMPAYAQTDQVVVQMPLPAQQVHGFLDASGAFHAYGEVAPS
jgi:hypothetical protein